MPDTETLAVYAARAADYAERFASGAPDATLKAFIEALAPGARVLDLGCGPATASAFMRAAGLCPDPVDASPEMVALANARHAIGARQAAFHEIDARGVYQGVWANFSLLHAPRADLPGHLAALHRALVPGGLLHIGMKTGRGEGRDALGRFYTYVTEPELIALLRGAGFTPVGTRTGTDTGLAGTEDSFILVTAHA